MRVAAKRFLLPAREPKPPESKLEKFRPLHDRSALELMDKNEDGQISLPLKSKIKVSHDSYIFRFEYPNAEWCLGIPVGKHVMFHAKIGGEDVTRKYTPISMV